MSGLLSENKWYILNFVLELDRRILTLKKKLSETPQGRSYARSRDGKTYYRYVYSENGKYVEKGISFEKFNSLSSLLKERDACINDIDLCIKAINSNLSVYKQITKELKKLIELTYQNTNAVVTENFYRPNELTLKAKNGIKVRSKSELLILNLFESYHLCYEYEPELFIRGYIKPWHPDFKITEPITGKQYFWEHVGLKTKAYELYFENKINAYRQAGITEGNNLIITYDEDNGSIDFSAIEKIINQKFRFSDYFEITEKYSAHKKK